MMGSYTTLAFSFLTVIIPVVFYNTVNWLLSTRRPLNFPPGPPSRLGLGNLHQIPRFYSFLKLDAWAKDYGPIMGLKLGPQNVVILNDASLVYDLMVKKAAVVSARPLMYIPQEHVLPDAKHSWSLWLRHDYSNRIRTITKHLLNGTGLSNLAPMQKAAGTRLVYNILQSGDKWMEHVAPWGLSTPVAMMSGASIQDFGESWIQEYGVSQTLMNELLDPAENQRVDLFPILRWVPPMFAEWKRKVPVARKALLQAYDALMTQAKKNRQGSFQSLSLIPRLLSQASDPSAAQEGRLSEHEIKLMMGGLFDAAVGSTMMTFQSVLLALAAHPDVQHRAQAEIDALFGSDTALPNKINIDKLPYLSACVTETLRWRPLGAYPIGPFGLPRETVVDEELLGYHIPKGTTVLLNQWSIAHDQEFYEEPERYIPERFIQDPVGAKEGVKSHYGRKALYSFGAGRRECPGKDLSLQNIKIAFSQILWAFDIIPVEPLDTEATTAYTPSVVLMPLPFKVKFVPRKSGEILLAEKVKADLMLSEILA